LREYGGATVVGEETGTRYEGFVAGSQETITLPHSRLQIGIPRYVNTYPGSEIQVSENRGLIPDLEKELTIKELLSEEDEWLEFAKNHFSN
jgi:hypothetical protein